MPFFLQPSSSGPGSEEGRKKEKFGDILKFMFMLKGLPAPLPVQRKHILDCLSGQPSPYHEVSVAPFESTCIPTATP